MPITLVVRSGETQTPGLEPPALTFDGTQRVVIGRGAGCDLRLPDTSISLRHASVEAKGAEYYLVDEGSTNGTFVGGVRLSPRTPRTLRSGDFIRIGRVWVEARIDAAPVTRDLAVATRDIALALVARAMAAHGDETHARLRVVEGRDAGLALLLADDDRIYVVGRGADCDLPLADADASREHVDVVRRKGAVFVRDRGAKNGSWLGEVELTDSREVLWKPAVMLRVGRTVIALEEPVASALLELESSEDDVLPEGAAASQPPPTLVSAPDPAPPPPSPPPAVEIAPSTPTPPSVRPPSSARARARAAWSVTDLLVMLAAVGILGLSIAGLVWLLRSN